MSKDKVVPFPTTAPLPAPGPPSEGQRVIFNIGRQRLAFDFFSQVTELNPEPAPVVPFAEVKPKKRPRARKAAGDGAAG